MSHRKHDESSLPPGEFRARKQKLVEGGVIFVIALSLCIYLGIRFAQDPATGDEPVAATITQPDTPARVAVVSEPVAAKEAAAVAPAGTEPAGAVEPDRGVESAVSATRGEAPPVQEILPEVPLVVTYATAEAAYFEGRYQDAADMFARYGAEHPGNAWGHYMHGLALWKAGHDAAARDALNEALAVKPDHLKSLINLARVELDLEQPEAALASIQRALAVAPQSRDARRVLGRVYHDLDRLEAAETAYLEVLRQDGDDAWALNNLGLIWIEGEDFERALQPLARAAELLPEVAVIRNNLATALERTGHPAQARAQFELAGELGSDRGEASLARLEAVVMPAEESAVDLAAVAAAWTLPGAAAEDPGDLARPGHDAVAAITPEQTGGEDER